LQQADAPKILVPPYFQPGDCIGYTNNDNMRRHH
jgi:hypothetical protein